MVDGFAYLRAALIVVDAGLQESRIKERETPVEFVFHDLLTETGQCLRPSPENVSD
jgi:hypothetical protein